MLPGASVRVRDDSASRDGLYGEDEHRSRRPPWGGGTVWRSSAEMGPWQEREGDATVGETERREE